MTAVFLFIRKKCASFFHGDCMSRSTDNNTHDDAYGSSDVVDYKKGEKDKATASTEAVVFAEGIVEEGQFAVSLAEEEHVLEEQFADELIEDRQVAVEPEKHIVRREQSRYEVISRKSALTRIKEEGFSDKFASRARIKLSLEYNKMSNTINGCVMSIEGLSAADERTCPDEICFHVKLTPITRNYKTKTKWKPITSKVFAFSFSLGPFQDDVDPNSNVCFRLYGKKKALVSRAKCFGECCVPLKKITESTEVLEFPQRLLPKATAPFDIRSIPSKMMSRVHNASYTPVATDSEIGTGDSVSISTGSETVIGDTAL